MDKLKAGIEKIKSEVLDEEQPFNGKHNYLINAMYNSVYDTPEAVLRDSKRYNLNERELNALKREIEKVFALDKGYADTIKF